ncbi:hypothetical protein CSOJ01_00467 [Colletotrichum sojae]|uniref:Uncharacterized protein n=1 Tax=Colletotrichum sojae TaxID=2175907 RepID=A0A8H6JXQ3_9PEZI|nr:hypothetical protein CSOJ01_00467 [Colletotrichum sojae]
MPWRNMLQNSTGMRYPQGRDQRLPAVDAHRANPTQRPQANTVEQQHLPTDEKPAPVHTYTYARRTAHGRRHFVRICRFRANKYPESSQVPSSSAGGAAQSAEDLQLIKVVSPLSAGHTLPSPDSITPPGQSNHGESPAQGLLALVCQTAMLPEKQEEQKRQQQHGEQEQEQEQERQPHL